MSGIRAHAAEESAGVFPSYLSYGAFFVLMLAGCLTLSYHERVFADASTSLRSFTVTDFLDARLTVYVPENPKWSSAVEKRNGIYALMLTTPAKYYPPATIEIIHNHHLNLPQSDFKEAALSGLNAIRKKSGVTSSIGLLDLEPVEHGDLWGYQNDFIFAYDNVDHEARALFARFKNGAPLTVYLLSGKGQVDHIAPMTDKILRHLRPLNIQ